MKKIFILLAIVLIFQSCLDKGETRVQLQGTESNLPPELKGLKIYTVSTGPMSEINVAVLNGHIAGEQYKEGKNDAYVTVINPADSTNVRIITAKSIISENDSIIVIKKR